MPIFYLEPKGGDTSDPRWETTSLREGCWVQAATEDLARKRVEMATIQMLDSKPGGVLYTPWLDPKLTDCWLDEPSIDVPDDKIVTATGRTISP